MDPVFIGSLLALAYFVIGRARKRPTHDGEWELDFSQLPRVSESEGVVTLWAVRDWTFDGKGKRVSGAWRDVRFPKERIMRAWLVVEPFIFWGKIAHTYLIFELEGGEAFGVSVEARRRRDQRYSPFMALFRSYELIYQWGTARDLLGIRALKRRHTQFLIPLKLSQEQVGALFGSMVGATNELFRAPRFYNTILANCTTELFDPIAKIDPAFKLSFSSRLLTARIHRLLVERGLVAGRLETQLDVTPHLIDLDPAVRTAEDSHAVFRALVRALGHDGKPLAEGRSGAF